MGGDPLLLSFIVVIIGGLGSLPGTVVAAILIGMSDGYHLGLLLADAGEDPRHAAGRPGAGVPAAGPVRASARHERGTRRSLAAARRRSSRCCSRCNFVLPAYHHGNLARIMVLAVLCDRLQRRCSAIPACSASATRCSSPPACTALGLPIAVPRARRRPRRCWSGVACGRRAGAGGRASGAAHRRRRLHDRHADVRAGGLSDAAASANWTRGDEGIVHATGRSGSSGAST